MRGFTTARALALCHVIFLLQGLGHYSAVQPRPVAAGFADHAHSGAAGGVGTGSGWGD